MPYRANLEKYRELYDKVRNIGGYKEYRATGTGCLPIFEDQFKTVFKAFKTNFSGI